jgi:hypothetical protein
LGAVQRGLLCQPVMHQPKQRSHHTAHTRQGVEQRVGSMRCDGGGMQPAMETTHNL